MKSVLAQFFLFTALIVVLSHCVIYHHHESNIVLAHHHDPAHQILSLLDLDDSYLLSQSFAAVPNAYTLSITIGIKLCLPDVSTKQVTPSPFAYNDFLPPEKYFPSTQRRGPPSA